jgi:hypothetical protein
VTQVDPTSPSVTNPVLTIADNTPTTPTSPTTPDVAPTVTQVDPTSPSVTNPVLTIADNTLWVAGRGGKVDLGVNVKTTDPNDRVTVNITGLPKYETITDKLDGQTFRGNNITLTAAQVDSGLVLQSNYRGGGHPVATLTLTANAKDPVTGAVASTAPQTITVANLRSAATTTTLSQPTSVTTPPTATGTTTTSQVDRALSWVNQNQDQASKAVATAAPALMSQLRGVLGDGVATSAPQAITATNDARSAGTPTASLANQSFALLNQHLAGSTGRVDSGQIVSGVSNGATAGQVSFLTRPQH